MKLFQNYLNGISDVLNKGVPDQTSLRSRSRVSDLIYKSNADDFRSEVKVFSEATTLGNLDLRSKALFNFDRTELEKYFGRNKASFPVMAIGSHPDFSHLKFDEYEYHYCVSMFVDIKGSTRLALKHSLEEVRLIKDSLLTLCIHVVNFFGGHVHRLQGDAVFVQFVRRGLHKNDAIINALNAATVLCQFVSNDLASLYLEKELNPIKIRVGIDYGENDEVLWSYYGIPGCNELTTTSLHTDLAAKLQAKAANNSIMIGEHLVSELDLPEEFYDVPEKKVDSKVEKDYYILKTPDYAYRQYMFNWDRYLKSFGFMVKNAEGVLEIAPGPYEITCSVGDKSTGLTSRYFQNAASIPKNYSIKYELRKHGSIYTKIPTEQISWEANNRGQEAKDQAQLNHDFGGRYKNVSFCETTAAYLGHHYLKCTIKRQFEDNLILRFPIFVQ